MFWKERAALGLRRQMLGRQWTDDLEAPGWGQPPLLGGRASHEGGGRMGPCRVLSRLPLASSSRSWTQDASLTERSSRWQEGAISAKAWLKGSH